MEWKRVIIDSQIIKTLKNYIWNKVIKFLLHLKKINILIESINFIIKTWVIFTILLQKQEKKSLQRSFLILTKMMCNLSMKTIWEKEWYTKIE